MAVKINAGDVGRGDLFFIDPKEIQVEEKLNGRWQPHDEAAIADLCKSYKEEGGQHQPVQVRRLADKRVQLVMGYRRYAAALLYNQTYPDTPMKLKCIVVTINDEEAFRRNIVENKERKETTPIDDAYNQRRLREEYGWADVRIAEFYRCTPVYISQLKKLLTLPTKVQQMIHNKTLAMGAALALADLDTKEQEEALSEALAEGGTSTKAVTKKVRAQKQKKGKSQARTLSEVREFFEEICTEYTGPMKNLADLILAFASGKNSDAVMERELEKLFGVEEKEAV